MRPHDNFRTRAAPRGGRFGADNRFLDQGAGGYASSDGSKGETARAEPGESAPCRFSFFRADSVSVTSTRFAGGDWRWRLSDHEGTTLVEGRGYRNEASCRRAVALLQARAARATVD